MRGPANRTLILQAFLTPSARDVPVCRPGSERHEALRSNLQRAFGDLDPTLDDRAHPGTHRCTEHQEAPSLAACLAARRVKETRCQATEPRRALRASWRKGTGGRLEILTEARLPATQPEQKLAAAILHLAVYDAGNRRLPLEQRRATVDFSASSWAKFRCDVAGVNVPVVRDWGAPATGRWSVPNMRSLRRLSTEYTSRIVSGDETERPSTTPAPAEAVASRLRGARWRRPEYRRAVGAQRVGHAADHCPLDSARCGITTSRARAHPQGRPVMRLWRLRRSCIEARASSV